MHLTKPMLGDCQAPQFWSDRFFSDLLHAGFCPRPLDMCIWMSHDGVGRLGGDLGVHVDGLALAKAIRFGKWRRDDKIQFTGMDIVTMSSCEIQVTQTAYLRKVCLVTLGKRRKETPDAPAHSEGAHRVACLVGSSAGAFRMSQRR